MDIVIKKLQKKMTRSELIDYLQTHPRWRCPTKEEAQKVFDMLPEEKVAFRILGDSYKNMAFIFDDQEQLKFTYISELVKIDVVLVQKLETCRDTGTVLYVEYDSAEDLQVAGLEYYSPYSKAKIIKKASLGKFDNIIESMTDKDYVVFEKTTRTIKLIVKEILEKVIEVDYPTKLSKSDVISRIEDLYLDGEIIKLNKEDYLGDYAIIECTTCEDERGDFITIDDDFNTEITRLSNDL
jgi:hypothetical protein